MRRCCSSKVNDDRLNLREQIESVRPLFSAPPALLEAAPRRSIVEGVVTIYPDRSGLQRRRGLMRLAQVASPNPGRQSEGSVVALPDGIGSIHEQSRTKDL